MRRAIAAALLGALLLAAPAQAAFPGQNGRIAYESDEGAPPNVELGPYYEIYTINPDGTGRERLTSNSSFDGDAAWSPDGSKIAFTNDSQIYTMAASGGAVTQLTNGPGANYRPAWSPDGSRIAFISTRDGGGGSGFNTEVYVMDADGTDQTPVGADGGDTEEEFPAWSPDGSRIAWQRILFHYDVNEETYIPEPPEIRVMDPDGSDQQVLWTGGPPAYAYEKAPAWSPDGERIAFQAYPEGIALINFDGSGLTVVNTPQIGEGHPAWSPDGSKIAFDAFTGGRGGVYTMNLDGSGVVNVNNTPGADEWRPDWQPVPVNTTAFYVRPKGATPFRVPLVPAYAACTAPNRTHGPPLAFPSCNPPQPGSSRLTIGVGDGSPAFARGMGSLRMDVLLGSPGPPDDSDVGIAFRLTNVMYASNQAEYTGSLRAELTVRRTDRELPGPIASTSMDLTAFELTVPCVPTPASTLDASTCNAFTSADAIVPGAITEASRAIWALEALRVYDGGPDDNAETESGNSLFMTQGVFVP